MAGYLQQPLRPLPLSVEPSSRQVDELLDERNELAG